MRYAWIAVLVAVAAMAQDAPRKATKAEVDKMMKDLSNWGRWGKDDQKGTVNLITPAKRKQAAALVKDGVAVSLAHDVLTENAVDDPEPFGHKMLFTGANPLEGDWQMDEYTVRFHGPAQTHMDALGHTAWGGNMYNGFPQKDVTDQGAKELGITNFKDGIFTRAVLFDIPRLKNLPYLEPGTPIYPEDLDAWEKKTGVKVGPGDIILIRSGRWARRAAKGPTGLSPAAGLHISAVPWLKKRDVALAGSELALDVIPSGVDGVAQPVHQVVLVAMGMPILDNLDLDKVADEAAKRNRWTFLITVAPLAVPGGTGSPINATAIF
jgi:kynurenine formamidase